jgi:hypothetical protein
MKTAILQSIRQLDKKVSRIAEAHPKKTPKAVDTIFKWAPLASVFILDAAGAKTKNNLQEHFYVATTSEALMNVVLKPLKNGLHRPRPNHNGKDNSFPSGHTATAFIGAEMLYQELKEAPAPVRLSGYLVAAATGALRVRKNKHWLSDVVVGAVLGIASAKAAYWLLKRGTTGVN